MGAGKDQSERFLKLLTAQMQNQDPLNPLDNAQVTSQMAQISTVTGISQLNETIGALIRSQLRSEAFAASGLVGKAVFVKTDRLSVADGNATGAFYLDGKSNNVVVDVRDRFGKVISTIQMGAQPEGLHNVSWSVPKSVNPAELTFRVRASAGSMSVDATTLSRSQVKAVALGNTGADLILANGLETPVSSVWRLEAGSLNND